MTTDRCTDVDVSAWPTGILPGGRRGADTLADLTVSRFTMEAVTAAGRAVAVEIECAGPLLVIWLRPSGCAVFNRAMVGKWLTDPREPLVHTGGLSLDLRVDPEGAIALTLPDGTVWPLSPMDLEQLQGHL